MEHKGIDSIIARSLMEWYESNPQEKASVDDIVSICKSDLVEYLDKHVHVYLRKIVKQSLKKQSSEKIPVEHPETKELVLVKVRDVLTIEERGTTKYVPVQFASQDDFEKHLQILDHNLLKCKLKHIAETMRYEQKFLQFAE